MATFKTSTVTIPLYGHGLEDVGSVQIEPIVTGTFAADSVTGADGNEYGVFTIAEPTNNAYPALWAGTYRVDVDRLTGTDVFA